MVSTISLYFDNNYVGSMVCTDVKINKNSYLYGGEEKFYYDVTIHFNNQFIFYANDKEDIIYQGNKLYIYNFGR